MGHRIHQYRKLHQKLRKKKITNVENKSGMLEDVKDGKKKVDSKIESCEEIWIKEIEDDNESEEIQIKEIKDDNERLRNELKKLEYEETLEAKKFADRVTLRDTEKNRRKAWKERYKNVKALLEEELEFLIRYVDFKKDVVDLMDVDDE
ncbi:26167_t:CDS:2 [Gigaspora margarita]|uniref:26167_t:CDS:1 n=1 Tax=Gigaspora margarita TaxID=4874 RepID=A0ABN7VVS6_GIGMA|nr:26167_t:CDS:2 [Gigaspora margarita]